MRIWQKLQMRWQSLFSRNRELQRLNAEIDLHLDELTQENIAAGMDPVAARQAALREFGNPMLLREQTGATWGWSNLETATRNLRIAARTLARTPGFALTSILIIAIGIGANVALFTVVRSVLLRPLPFRDSAQLLRVYERSTGKFSYNSVAGGVFAEWDRQNKSFSDLSLYQVRKYNLSGNGQPAEKAAGNTCSWNLFRTLGVDAALGRSFSKSDDRPGAPATVILSWALWKTRFNGDPAILNRTIHLDARSYTVIGIMPAWFNFPDQSVKLWTPIYHDARPDILKSLGFHTFQAIGRLKPGVTEAQAAAELSVIVRRLHDENPDNAAISKAANSRPLLEAMIGEVRRPLYLLLCATACLLLIACLNVANLMVARGAARTRELAIRTALGGRRWRLFCEQWTESLLLSAVGGVIGCAVSYGAVRWFVHLRKDVARIETVHVDGQVLAFACGLILLCALLASMASTVFLNRGDILSSLRKSSRTHSIGRGGVGLRKGLLSMEVALTLVLLLVAGLLLKSYQRLRSSEMGCITENVISIPLNLPAESYATPAQRLRFFDSLMAQVRNLPGVRASALVQVLPGEGYYGDLSFSVVEQPPLPPGQARYAILRCADPGYFSAMGIPLLRGRTFREDRRLEQADEVVISDSFARRHFPGEDPIGKHLTGVFGPQSYTIVGIVGDTRFSIEEPPQPTMYYSIYSGEFSGASLAIRSERSAADLGPSIRRLVQQLDPDLAIAEIRTLDEIIGLSAQDRSFEATLLLAFAGLSLALAAAGLFGVLSYIVAQRTSEIGIRMALGAQRVEVLKSMLLDGLYPSFAGVVFGIAGGLMAVRLIRSMLYGISPFDPVVFASVVSLLLLVSVVACLAPAWQASRLNPMAALRSE